MCNGMVAAETRALVPGFPVHRPLLSLLFLLAFISPGQAFVCQPPFEPENGGYTCHPLPCHQFTQGTVIEYFCDEGYALKGDNKYLTCQNGEWDSPMQISCILDSVQGCMRPPSVQHSWVNLTESNRGTFPAGTLLQYSCDSGYMLDGPSTIFCTGSGHWSAKPPQCTRSEVCRPPFEPENGGYTCHPLPCHQLTQGTVIEYFCDEGYALKGDYKYLTCQNGEWDSPMRISCHPVQVCRPPFEPENGGYTCHPLPCHQLTQGTVIEYFCDEGYALKGDYKYLTCQNGEWDSPMRISCHPVQERDLPSPSGMPTLPIVAATAGSVALLLLLVVLFVLLQPRLKSFQTSRREQGMAGQPVSIVVEGVQVSLPSYEEAVYGSGATSVSAPSPAPVLSLSPSPAPPMEAHLQITPADRSWEDGSQGPGRGQEAAQAERNCPSTSRQPEVVLVHQVPSAASCSSSSSSQAPEQASTLGSRPRRQDSFSSDEHCLLSPVSAEDLADDIPLLKEA